MKVVCANCGKIKEGTSGNSTEKDISHGICPLCYIALYSRALSKEELEKDLFKLYEEEGQKEWLPNDGSSFQEKIRPTVQDEKIYREIISKIKSQLGEVERINKK